MCHGYHPEWESSRRTDRSEETDDDTPSFLAEESSTDTELLTDGGDDAEADEDETA